jgi:hypothetical protein
MKTISKADPKSNKIKEWHLKVTKKVHANTLQLKKTAIIQSKNTYLSQRKYLSLAAIQTRRRFL